MSRLSEAVYWLWVEAQLGAPPLAQRTVIPALHRAKETARLLARPYMPLYELVGQNEAGPLTVTYGGLGYAKPLLKSMLFLEEPVEREVDRIPVWYPDERFRSLSSDLVFIESDRYLIRRLPSQSAITLPFRVQFVLDLQGGWQEVEQRFRRSTRRHIRKAREYDCYEFEISHREQDLALFYHTMYLPTMQERHGALAAVCSEKEAYQLLRYGWLFFVKQDGVRVCGSIGYARQGIVEFREMGMLNGDVRLMSEGVVDGMNYLRIRWAQQEGYQALSFGECWPYMSGIFWFKRKWGAAVSVPAYEHKRFWIKVQRNTPAVSQFFASNPCVIVDGGKELQGLIVTDDPDAVPTETEARWRKRYTTPGLNGLIVCSVANLMERPAF